MSTQTEVDPRLVECEKHELANCSLCNNPVRRPYVRRYTEPTAVGTTKVEVVSSLAGFLGLPQPDFSTAGELVSFWRSLAEFLDLEVGPPAFVAQQVAFRADVEWTEYCATSPSHVTLYGLLRVRDAVRKLYERKPEPLPE